jgi:hypothetical protein
VKAASLSLRDRDIPGGVRWRLPRGLGLQVGDTAAAAARYLAMLVAIVQVTSATLAGKNA